MKSGLLLKTRSTACGSISTPGFSVSVMLSRDVSIFIGALHLRPAPSVISKRSRGTQDLRRCLVDAPPVGRDLLIVGDVGLEYSNGARDQKYDDAQRNENLHYGE